MERNHDDDDPDDPGYPNEPENDVENNENELLELAVMAVLHAEDSSDDDEGGAQRVYVDIEGWRRLEGPSFKMHFRMRRDTFQKLVVAVGRHLRRQGKLRWSQTPVDLALLFTLWVLANPDTFRSTGTTFGKGGSSMHHHYSYMIAALSELSSEFVKWPSARERTHIRHQFEMTYGYPGVVGCIDGTYFVITAPLEDKRAYVTRHHNYAFIVQAVCDHNLLYRDVYVGEPGSLGDRRVFTNSPLSQMLLRHPDQIEEDEHLLGDSAYPLSRHLITPYLDDGHLSPRRRRHNYELSRVRAAVERSFALLFGKETRSKYHRTYSWPITTDHAMAAIVVHNFRILEEVVEFQFEDRDPIGDPLEGPDDELMEASAYIGVMKREYIASLFHAEDE